MKTMTEARLLPVACRAAAAPWWLWLGLALGLAGLPPSAQAQVTVKTLGGGPIQVGGPFNGFVNGTTLQESQFDTPSGCALDSGGFLYVADRNNDAVRKLDVAGDRCQTFLTGANGLSKPVAVALDSGDNLYVANQGDGTVRTFDPWGNALNTYSGLVQPTALGLDGTTIYVTELGGAVKRIADGTITLVTQGFAQPHGLAVLDSFTLAISENHAIRLLDLTTLQADFLAGTNAPGFTNGPGNLARFNQPQQIVRAPNGTLIVADRMNNCVRAVDANGVTITLYGVRSNQWENCSVCYPGWLDGDVEVAEAREPVGVAIGREGTVYTTEVFYDLVRSVGTSLAVTNATNTVLTAIITPNGATTNNRVLVTLTPLTPGAELWYRVVTNKTTDLTLPAPGAKGSSRYDDRPFWLDTSGSLFVRGFKAGFLSSDLARADFTFTVSDPVILPNGATSDNPVLVTLTSNTDEAELRWTSDGSEPTRSSHLYLRPFPLGISGTLKVKGFRDGFAASQTVSANFNLEVGTPQVTPESGTFTNSVVITMSSTSTNAELRYTLDASEPTTNSLVYSGPFSLTTNTTLKVTGLLNGFEPSITITRELTIQVDTPVLSPTTGFYPNGTTLTLTVQRPDAAIYYTVNGQDPTPADQRYTGPFTVFSPGTDLRGFRARAFAPNTVPSAVVSGTPATTNSIGVSRDLVAGIGSTIVVPVVVNLTTNDVLRSLQFRVEVSPGSADGQPLTRTLRSLDISTNDFIQVAAPSEAGSVAHLSSSVYAHDAIQGLAISAVGTNANFVARNFATVALLAVTIPPDAKPNDTYRIDILTPSGTSDGQQAAVPLTTLPSRTITVANVPYIVGDSSLGIWYNAGDFGDGNLDNRDVNNAFYASVGIRVPYEFTDIFNAMDVFPEDVNGQPGGDGQIRYLDWQHILNRSLRRDPNNWRRAWGPGGTRVTAGASLPGLQRLARGSASQPSGVWYRQAAFGAGSIGNANPNSDVELPVYVSLVPNASFSGGQFKVTVTPEDTAPPLLDPISFIPAKDVPAPGWTAQPALNQVGCGWVLGAFNPALTSSNLLGYLHVRLPVNAPFGYAYSVVFSFADASPDDQTQYDCETRRGGIWIQTPAPATADLISDQWKTNFFGSVTNALAAPNADPDGDGLTNLAEYLGGTNPTVNDFPLALLTPEVRPAATGSSIVLHWVAVPGRNYSLEATADLNSGNWTALATNITATGQLAEYVESNPTNATQFYRVRLNP